MLILGLSPFKRGPAAALFRNGAVRAAIENDKLTRSSTRGLPEAAIRFCLESAGIGWSDLDFVAVTSSPVYDWLRKAVAHVKLSAAAPVAGAYRQAKEVGALSRKLNDLRMLKQKTVGSTKIVSFDHHLCHAASAFFQSPFDRALILTLDEDGEGRSGALAVGEGTRIRVLRRLNFPHSLGWVYSQITHLIGFRPHQDEHKTQWLSLEGEALFKDVFFEMFRNSHDSLPHFSRALLSREATGRLTFSAEFYRRIGVSSQTELSDDQCKGLACSIQYAYAEIITGLLKHFMATEKADRICLGGGLFQNSLLVSTLEKNFGLNQVFVPPAPGNPGSSLGAALLLWHQVLQKPRCKPVAGVYWGPRSSRQEIKDVLDNSKARYALQNTEERRIDAAVKLLQSGKIVGWYQGATEFGPRALGNRSILASPWAPYVKENLNDFIKHREWFRPFAVSVPEEDCPRYFEASQLCRFMNSLAWVRQGRDSLPPSLLLRGGRLRLHVVERRSNPLFWRLLKRFGEQAPAPLLLNTSFNLFGEPLVTAPRDAMRSYFCSGVDALVLDNFVLSKSATPPVFTADTQLGQLVRLGS